MAKKKSVPKKTFLEKVGDKAAHLKDDLVAGKDHLVEMAGEAFDSVKSGIQNLTQKKKPAPRKSAKKASPKKALKKSITKKVAPKKVQKKLSPKKVAKKITPKKIAKKATPKKASKK